MDMQANMMMKEKRSLISRFTVACCLILTAALLISSLVSPKRPHADNSRITPNVLTSSLPS